MTNLETGTQSDASLHRELLYLGRERLLFFIIIQFVTLPAKAVLGIWFAIQIVMSVMGSSTGGGVAWLAHVGGFVAGFILGWFLRGNRVA